MAGVNSLVLRLSAMRDIGRESQSGGARARQAEEQGEARRGSHTWSPGHEVTPALVAYIRRELIRKKSR